jgi:hypothetical protein
VFDHTGDATELMPLWMEGDHVVLVFEPFLIFNTPGIMCAKRIDLCIEE